MSRNVDASTDKPSGTPEVQKPQASPEVLTVAERDAALMNAWRDREGSLANAELEDGKLEEGYRRNVVSWSCVFRMILLIASIESKYIPSDLASAHMLRTPNHRHTD